jgi:hypothetical protein
MYRVIHSAVIAAAILIAAGCGVYTLSGGMPDHIRTVGVDLFENRTSEPGVDDWMSRALSDRLIARPQIRYGSMRVADAVIRGAVRQVIEEPLEYSGAQVTRYQVLLIVDAEVFDRVRRRALWSGDGIRGIGSYDATGGIAARERAFATAVGDAAQQIIDGMVSGW